MDNYFKKILRRKLYYFAAAVVKKYKPDIIGITGSMGKTSTKDAVYCVLGKSGLKVRKNIKNYNNEIGVPLTIIGKEAAGRNIFKWFLILGRALRLLVFKDRNYPDVVILEMASDRKGDIDYLTRLAPIKIGIVTNISTVHTEFLGSTANIAQEKSFLVKNIIPGGFAILNHDDELVLKMKGLTQETTFTFGFSPDADFTAGNLNLLYKEEDYNVKGVSFDASYRGKTTKFFLPQVLGSHLVYSVLPAIISGLLYKMDSEKIVSALREYVSPRGRMRIVPGIKDTQIIDDTYNSSPLACKVALKTLGEIRLPEKFKRYAVLGDMLELGSISEEAHKEVGKAVFSYGADVLICVGERARDIARGALSAGMPSENIFTFSDRVAAGKFLQQRMKTKDIILVKGSQGMRMETIVREIMAEPENAEQLLVRQEPGWQK
ncbi:UDP-N-acetylmuramoyl-tripeptide--D-alanyl-D-alanine ligase [Candidatus Parcubacteria bacterium]|nr:MAG: UDP-N-acetylmuramoyl-tripeptide--D-alanyl-D-alanine ligase [Candidatus Parcubacteria bacterium]